MSHYFRYNIWVTTSCVVWQPAIKFCQQVMGEDRVRYAMEYPYQQSSNALAADDGMDISDAAQLQLMQSNAERVFKL